MFDQVLYWITSGVPNNAESVLKNRKSNELPSTFQAVHLLHTLGVWSDIFKAIEKRRTPVLSKNVFMNSFTLLHADDGSDTACYRY